MHTPRRDMPCERHVAAAVYDMFMLRATRGALRADTLTQADATLYAARRRQR